MNESAISIFRKIPETKDQIKKYSHLVRESVLNLEVEPLQFACYVSALEQLFKALKQDVLIKDAILEEAEKYGSKSFERYNAKFQIKEVGVSYDFSECNDFELAQLDVQIKKLQSKKKERETFLKTIKPEMEVYGSDGVQLNPPLKRSTTSVAIILK